MKARRFLPASGWEMLGGGGNWSGFGGGNGNFGSSNIQQNILGEAPSPPWINPRRTWWETPPR